MDQTKIDVGDVVRITAGPYKGLEGVLEDRQPECGVVRVDTKEGTAYCYTGEAVRATKPLTKGKALLKR